MNNFCTYCRVLCVTTYCYRPKTNKKAKRYSGCILIYYKTWLSDNTELVNLINKCIVWVKIKRDIFVSEKDLYFCVTYIPPEDSTVYKTVYDFDLYHFI